MVNQYLFASINYDPVADFAPVTLICLFPNLMIVRSSSPYRSVGELIAFAKANPRKLTFGTPGHGSSPHMTMRCALFQSPLPAHHRPCSAADKALGGAACARLRLNAAGVISRPPRFRREPPG